MAIFDWLKGNKSRDAKDAKSSALANDVDIQEMVRRAEFDRRLELEQELENIRRLQRERELKQEKYSVIDLNDDDDFDNDAYRAAVDYNNRRLQDGFDHTEEIDGYDDVDDDDSGFIESYRYISGEQYIDDKEDDDEEEGEHSAAAEQKGKVLDNNSAVRLFLSGDFLLKKNIAKFAPHLILLAILSLISVSTLFWSLYNDVDYKREQRAVQMLHERSLRMYQSRIRASSYSAVEREMERRKLGLERANTPSKVIK